MRQIDPRAAENVPHLGVENRRVGVDKAVNAVFLDKLIPVVRRRCIVSRLAFIRSGAFMVHPYSMFRVNGDLALEKIEILILFPLARVVSGGLDAIVPHIRHETAELCAFDLEIIVHEYFAKLAAEQRLCFHRDQRVLKAFRKHRAVGGIRISFRRAGIVSIVDSSNPAISCDRT